MHSFSSAFSCRWGEAELISLLLSVQTRFRTSVNSSGTDFGKFMDKFITRTKRSCDDNASSAPTPKKCKTQKYDISYLQFGFTVAGTDAEPLPQCVICADLLANDSMKPCKLKHHLETKHPTLKDKSLDLFKLKLSGLEQQKRNLSKHTSMSNRCLEASNYVSIRVAKVGKPHTIAEALILPAAKDICQVMSGDNFAQQISDIPLSNDTCCFVSFPGLKGIPRRTGSLRDVTGKAFRW